MPDFTEWIDALRGEQEAAATSPMSSASSWQDTDSDTDSDHEDNQFRSYWKARQAAKRKDMHTRTAPILIPTTSEHHTHRRYPQFLHEFDESVSQTNNDRLYQTAQYYAANPDEMDEDDPVFYGNLAYFQSQNSSKSATMKPRSRFHARSTELSLESSVEDEEIFDMEL